MKKLFKSNKIYKKIFIITILVYVVCIFIGQEKTLISYRKSQKDYENQISAKTAEQQELNATKSNITSKEYIEEVAREKLDMYLPNERVYVDKGK